MTLKEAKKILEKEGFHLALASKVINQRIREFEKPEVCEAIKVANANKWTIGLPHIEWVEREARLKEEYEKNTKAPGPGEEQPKEDNPALKEAASQFNDSLLDEQAKKIEKLTKENEDWKSWHEMQNRTIAINNIAFRNEKNRFGKEIARLNKIIHKKNMKTEELRKESSRHLRGKVKLFGETVDLMEALRKTESLLNDTREANSKNLDTCFKNEDIIDDLKKKLAEKTKLVKKYAKELSDSSLDLCKLEKKLKDKNAILSDVAEELRLSKIREKNLAELGLKYVGENEKLKKELADKVVDKIDAQALKSAESALAEKDEVIADLGEELAATKKELEAFKESYKRRIKEDSEHFEHIQKICNAGLQKWLIESEYLEKDKPFRFPQQPELSKEELMKIQEKVVASCDIAEEGGDQSATIVQCDNGITLSKEEAEIVERCTKNGMELHYSEKYGFTYTNVFGEEMPISYLCGIFHVFTDEEIKNMKK